MANTYHEWIKAKSAIPQRQGMDIAPEQIAPHLFGFQSDLVRWALKKGRAALFADTGLGKTAMQLEWARHVAAKVGRVLIVTPLAVAQQTVKEGARFGVDAKYLAEDDPAITVGVTNYDRIHLFDPMQFGGIVLDESSILKNFNGKTRNLIIETFAELPFKLCCTATPAPNDFTELGNHSEFLGAKSRVEMLSEYFVHDGGSTADWRLKGHAVAGFWEWIASWGAFVKRPSDLGYSDEGFDLPPLNVATKIIGVDHEAAQRMGRLFAADVKTLNDSRATRRATMHQRIEAAIELTKGDAPAIVWCELNDEADACESAIPGAIQVSGSDDPDVKVERLIGFAEGRYRVMVTKGKIAGFGMNWQHCSRMVFLGASHSYEQTYQSIRRCWRFGQTKPVDVTIIMAETEGGVIENYRRKEADAETLSKQMTARISDYVRRDVRGMTPKRWNEYNPTIPMEIPTWLK
jgi:hypothetical protein